MKEIIKLMKNDNIAAYPANHRIIVELINQDGSFNDSHIHQLYPAYHNASYHLHLFISRPLYITTDLISKLRHSLSTYRDNTTDRNLPKIIIHIPKFGHDNVYNPVWQLFCGLERVKIIQESFVEPIMFRDSRTSFNLYKRSDVDLISSDNGPYDNYFVITFDYMANDYVYKFISLRRNELEEIIKSRGDGITWQRVLNISCN